MILPILLAAGGPLDPTKLVEFLKFGQFGAALAMLILGFYLHWQASHSQQQIEARKKVASQFMNYAIAFFVICALGELLNGIIPRPDRVVTVTVLVPPLDETNAKDYGDLEVVSSHGNSPKERKKALGEGQAFDIHQGTNISINLQRLVEKLAEIKSSKQALENSLAKETPTLGAGGPL